MKKLARLDSLTAFARTYDSGGFFWSLFTGAGDGKISAGELALKSGRVMADAVAFLQFEMHLDGLRPAERAEALRMLDEKMTERREKCIPVRTTVSGFAKDAALYKTAIVEGIAEPLADPLEFAAGLRMKAPVLGAPVPASIYVAGRFSVWRLCEGSGKEGILVVSEGARKKIPEGRIRVGGMALEAESKRDAWVNKCFLAHFYLEA